MILKLKLGYNKQDKIMYFLKCSKCGYFNEVKTDYLMFCAGCNKKLDNNYTEWQVYNPDKTSEDFKRLVCISEEEMRKNSVAETPKKKLNLKYWIAFAVAFAIFYAIGKFGGEAIYKSLSKPHFEKVLVDLSNELNKNCPLMIDAETRLDNTVALPNNIFQYNYSLIIIDKESINIDEAKTYLEQQIVNTAKTNPDLKVFRDNKTTLRYTYKDKSGVFILTIEVSPDKYE